MRAAEPVPPEPGAPQEQAIVAVLRSAGSVFAEEEARLLVREAQTPAELASAVDRRVAGVPLEQVLGWTEFCGIRIVVGPGVFVPRRRTELLVREAVALVPPGRVVVDLCCGSGAVGAALSAALSGQVDEVELYAVDIDPAAVEYARRNLASAAWVRSGDLYDPLPANLRGRVDVLVANAPYVPTEAIGLMPPEARVHEPRVTLDGGGDGLDVVRRVTAGAASWLRPGGALLVEAGQDQVPEVIETFAGHGLSPQVRTCDEVGGTVVIGTHDGAARSSSRTA